MGSPGKAPAFQFYIKDWLSDFELQSASSSTRGVWINALCLMWTSKTRGKLTGQSEILCRILNCTQPEFDVFKAEAQALGFCYIKCDADSNITLENRRMRREEKARENNRERQRRHYEKKKPNGGSNKNLTTPSASPSPKKRKAELKKLSNGSKDHTLCDKYSQECGIAGVSYEQLQDWCRKELVKIERGE